ncbi:MULTISPECIES: hypothetical protein [unclassified Guyparkeria]|uniref:hypothetical protein n=1 Tax=unclassified Guyparkeria TaxID=2626246 RepID=UPI0007339321|nr:MULTISPECIES: hypothetical protein [unclassified Guyparkeria]KTG15895.1 hypothetical protein AUR63_06145 [Guyparkeria sp. XI15]OAE84645.1 hypothetical protein AWR35_06155 [Guyparkeria sp. WRN-7]
MMLLAVVGLLLLAGIGLGLAGLYHALTPHWGVAGSLGAIAGLCLLVAAAFATWAYRWLR